MNSIEYCYQKAAPKGSAFYFSLAKLAKADKEMVVAIAALYEELNDVVDECHDPMLAQTKFNWWRGEVAKLAGGHSDHPVILILQKHWQHYQLPLSRFQEMIDATEQCLNLSPFNTFEDVTVHILHTAGARELLIADVLKKDEDVSIETIYWLAIVMELVKHIQYLRKDAQRGLVFFGEDELANHRVTLTMLQLLKPTDDIRSLLSYQSEKIERSYQKPLETLTPIAKKRLASILIRCEIAMTVLREIQASQFDVMQSLITITPLRRWWVAFKTRLKMI